MKAKYLFRRILILAILLSLIFLVWLVFIKDKSDQASDSDTETSGTTNALNTTATITPDPEKTSTPSPTPEPPPEIMTEAFNYSFTDVNPDKLPVFSGLNAFSNKAMSKTFGNDTLKYWIFSDKTPVNNYTSESNISFGSASEYTKVEGITTFRGNNYRNNASFGTRLVSEKKLEVVWTKEISVIDTWPGVGWTGQPLIIHWPEDVRKHMNIDSSMKNTDLVEVIYPTLDGNIYFLNLANGKQTRSPIHIGFPTKGTGMIDPRGYPILYTGQGINKNGTNYSPLKYRIFSLLDQKEIFSIEGTTPEAFRIWGAFDSSGLLDKKTDTLIQCGENGLIYKIKMNTQFDKTNGKLSIDPKLTKYRYQGVYNDHIGIENSPVIYKNFLYVADNGGLLQCIDINTLKPVWFADLDDDTDSTMVLEETSDGVFIYTGNEADLQCVTTGKTSANSTLRKFNALTGELIWEKGYSCIYQNWVNGGLLSTPVIGKNDISDLIIFNIALTVDATKGKMVALDKKTGNEVWAKELNYYSWSSPVDFLSDDGKTYMIFCDYNGKMHLIDPKTGETLDSISVGLNVEGSPAVYGDMAVIGSYAKKIYGVRIK